MVSKTDVRVFDGLSIVKVEGFKPAEPAPQDQTGLTHLVDRPGTANWLLESYGMAADACYGPGILWQDYDYDGWKFAVLIATEEVDAFRSAAEAAGYDVISAEEIVKPTKFGDCHAGTVEILKHRDGWVVLD